MVYFENNKLQIGYEHAESMNEVDSFS